MPSLSPEMEAAVAKEAAKLVAAEAMKEAGGAKRLVVFPLATITQMTGLSRHTIPQRLPVTEASPGKHGVTLENLETYLDGKTVWPGQEREKARKASTKLKAVS